MSVDRGPPMIFLRHLRCFTIALAPALVAVGLSSVRANGQQKESLSRPGAGSAQGELTVTLTVVASVGMVIDADGEPRLMVANAADAKDNVSAIKKVVLTPVTPDSAKPNPKQRSKDGTSAR